MKIKLYTLILSLQFCLSGYIKGQFYNMPGDYFFSLLTEKVLAGRDSNTHSGIKPYIHFFSQKYVHVEDSHRVFRFIHNDPALDATFYKHLVRVEPKGEKFKLHLDPLMNFETGKVLNAKLITRPFTNTRGFVGSGYIGDKVYFESMFAENQAYFPDYLSNVVHTTRVVPGQGRWKIFRSYGYDYAFSSGFVSVQPLKNLNIQAGHGKQKIGYGYRSLLLSDNSFNYPYARFTQQWFKGRVQYSNIYAVLMNLVRASTKADTLGDYLRQKKAASFQYLSINPCKFINIGFFQGMIWTAGDNRNRQQLDWRYFNPVIYSNLPYYGLSNKNNIVAGGDLKIKLKNNLNIYAQVMADDLSNSDSLGKGYGYQAGFNYFDAFGVKNFFIQSEFNNVSETSYRNVTGAAADQSYTHYNQNLAYTPGCGQELVIIMDYKYRRWTMNVKYNYQDVPSGGKTYYLNNIFNARIGYVINPAYNLNISAGYTYRNQNFYNFKTLNNETSYFFIGLRTSLYNFYYDF